MKEKILLSEITTELKTSYLSYALSVIIARAIPDVRDGLKPVQRRLLYTLTELGLRHTAKYMKSARIVGDCLGKFHPHGDVITYEALARLGQDFSMRYPLVDGQGNFGSIDGDPPAAMRYTEARLTALAEELVADIDKQTVDFMPNYDNTLKEPQVLPARVPQLLINGNLGIAVGMTTSIPPHNLREVCDALLYLIDHKQATLKDILGLIKGPDFPSGGYIYGVQSLRQAYETGRGRIVVRGHYVVEESKRAGLRLVITEIPFQVNKAELVRQIAELSLTKTLPHIKDVRDESNKDGIRVVIEIREGDPHQLMNRLCRLTDFQKNFYFNFVALEQGLQPKLFDLKSLLTAWLDHRKEVILRRSQFDLHKTRERIHILEGYEKALAKLDTVIRIIRTSKDKSQAKNRLLKLLKLSAEQAEQILELPLRTLTSLERQRLLAELKEKTKLEQALLEIIKNPKRLEAVLKQEIETIKTKYGDARRTKIISSELREESSVELQAEPILLFVNAKGLVSTLAVTTPIERVTKDQENFGQFFLTTTTEKLWVVSRQGKLYQLAIANFLSGPKYLEAEMVLERDDAVVSIFCPPPKAKFVYIFTRQGFGKKIQLQECLSQRRHGIQVIKVQKGDQVVSAGAYTQADFFAVTAAGLCLVFKDDLPVQSKAAGGVRVIKLKNDYLFTAGPRSGNRLVLAFRQGFVKKLDLAELKLQRRGGVGSKVFEPSAKLGELVAAVTVSDEQRLIIVNQKIQLLTVKSLPLAKRLHQPKPIIDQIRTVNVLEAQRDH